MVATGNNESGQCNVSEWKGITAIAAGCSHTVGLCADGTVVATGDNENGQCNVSEWKGITAIAAGYNYTVGVHADGTLTVAGYHSRVGEQLSRWTGIVYIVAEYNHIVGLRADGTVIAAGDNTYGRCNVEDWKSIVSIAISYDFTVGLCADGSVVVAGAIDDEHDVSGWHDIISIAASDRIYGLTASGTVLIAGPAEDYDDTDIKRWKLFNSAPSPIKQSPSKHLPVEELPDGTVAYDIFGDYFLMTTLRENCFRLWKNYLTAFEVYKQGAKEAYLNMKSYDHYMKNLDVMLNKLQELILDSVVKSLISFGIYEYNTAILTREYGKEFAPVYTTLMKDQRAVYEKLQSVPASPEVDKVKAKLFSDKETITTFINAGGLMRTIGYSIEKRILLERGLIEDYDFDSEKAAALRDNCMHAGNIGRSQQRAILSQAFKANPIDTDVIETALILKLDDSGGLAEYAKKYGYYEGFLSKQKEVLERKYADRLKRLAGCKSVPDTKTFCELASSCATMQEDGMDMSAQLKRLIDMRIAAGLSEQDVEDLAFFMRSTEDSFGPAVVTDTIQQFSQAQIQQDIAARTINGILYETHEQAAFAQAEVDHLRQLLRKKTEVAGFALLMEQEIKTEAGRKEYEIQEKMLLKHYQTDWRNPVMYLLCGKKRKEFDQTFRISEGHIVKL